MSAGPHSLEFFFDCSSPWTYLAFLGLPQAMRGCEVNILWRPILVGAVFNAVNREVYATREQPNPRRLDYTKKDLADWCRYYDVSFAEPETFPVNSARAMRGVLIAMEQGCGNAYISSVFRCYWMEGRDISRPHVLDGVAQSVGMDVEDFRANVDADEYKQRLRANTSELMERGGFGSPTFFLDQHDMYFGNDRLPLLRKAIEARD